MPPTWTRRQPRLLPLLQLQQPQPQPQTLGWGVLHPSAPHLPCLLLGVTEWPVQEPVMQVASAHPRLHPTQWMSPWTCGLFSGVISTSKQIQALLDKLCIVALKKICTHKLLSRIVMCLFDDDKLLLFAVSDLKSNFVSYILHCCIFILALRLLNVKCGIIELNVNSTCR